MRVLSAADIESVMLMSEWIDAVAPAFTAIQEAAVQSIPRQSIELSAGHGLMMAAAAPGVGMISKTVADMPQNSARNLPGTIGLALLMEESTGEPLCVLDGAAFTAWRTGAICGYAQRLLAPASPRHGVLIGCGAQAVAQLVVLANTTGLEDITVIGHRPGQAGRFVRENAHRSPLTLLSTESPAHALRQADIIVCATNSPTPVFDAQWLKPGCHVSAIGSYRADMQEMDPVLMQRARVFVESRKTASQGAGELLAAERAGWTRSVDWIELGEVISGAQPGRLGPHDLTVFKSVGHAAFDLFAARAVYDAAAERDYGQLLNSKLIDS